MSGFRARPSVHCTVYSIQYEYICVVVAFASSVTFHAEIQIIFGTGRAELL